MKELTKVPFHFVPFLYCHNLNCTKYTPRLMLHSKMVNIPFTEEPSQLRFADCLLFVRRDKYEKQIKSLMRSKKCLEGNIVFVITQYYLIAANGCTLSGPVRFLLFQVIFTHKI